MRYAISELILLLLMAGGVFLPNPIGMPPLPEDPRLLGCAPAATLAYVQWFGTAEPNPRSPNATELLAAEPDVQRFVRAVRGAIVAGMDAEARGEPSAAAAVEIGALAVTRPGCAFVVPDPGAEPAFGWGLVVNVGAQTDRVRGLAQKIVASMQDADRTREIAGVEFHVLDAGGTEAGWTVHGDHLVFAYGPASLAATAAGLGSARGLADNARFAASHGRVAVARPSLRSFVDIGALVELVGGMEPQARTAFEALGCADVTAYCSESGLEAEGFVGRSMLTTSGRRGLLGLLDGPALDASALAVVPADATAAFVVKLDPAKAWQLAFEAARGIDPRNAAQAETEIDGAMQQMFGLDLRDDLLAHVGDTWALWSSPAQGSLLGLGACACVTLKDEAAFAKSFEQVMDRLRAMMPPLEPNEWGRLPRGVRLEVLERSGAKIHWLNTIGDEMPVAPAWAVHGGRLWIATFPQVLEAALAAPAGAGLDAKPAVGARVFTRIDMRAAMTTLYAPLLMLGQVAAGELQREGVPIDVTCVPRLAALAPHLGVETMSVEVRPEGLVATSRGTIPRFDPGAGVAVPLFGILPLWMMAAQVEVLREVERAQAAEEETKRREPGK